MRTTAVILGLLFAIFVGPGVFLVDVFLGAAFGLFFYLETLNGWYFWNIWKFRRDINRYSGNMSNRS